VAQFINPVRDSDLDWRSCGAPLLRGIVIKAIASVAVSMMRREHSALLPTRAMPAVNAP